MAKLPKAFKRKDHGSKGFTVPTGEYIGKVIESDYKENKKKNGHYLMLTFELQNKKVKGKKVRVILNLDNPSETSVELANDELASICDAIGKTGVKDSKELHGKLMILKIREVPAEGSNPPQNEIDMYINMEEGGESSDEDEEEEEEEEVDSEEEEEEDKEVTVDEVKDLARKYKSATSSKKLKKVLEEYEIEKVSEIKTLDEDDLESLKDDLEEEMD